VSLGIAREPLRPRVSKDERDSLQVEGHGVSNDGVDDGGLINELATRGYLNIVVCC